MPAGLQPETAPPQDGRHCDDHPGMELRQRADDRRRRCGSGCAVYREQTAPLVDFYRATGRLAGGRRDGPAGRGSTPRWHERGGSRSGMVFTRSRKEIEKIRGRRSWWRETLRELGRAVTTGRHDRRAGPPRGNASSGITARRPAFKGYRGFPASICSVGERRSGARDSGPARVERGGHHRHRRGSREGRLLRRRGAHLRGRGGRATKPEGCCDVTREALMQGHRAGPPGQPGR